MRANDRSIVEVLQWRSALGIEQAQSNPAVEELWQKFAAVYEYLPLEKLSETSEIFAEFDAVEL